MVSFQPQPKQLVNNEIVIIVFEVNCLIAFFVTNGGGMGNFSSNQFAPLKIR